MGHPEAGFQPIEAEYQDPRTQELRDFGPKPHLSESGVNSSPPISTVPLSAYPLTGSNLRVSIFDVLSDLAFELLVFSGCSSPRSVRP